MVYQMYCTLVCAVHALPVEYLQHSVCCDHAFFLCCELFHHLKIDELRMELLPFLSILFFACVGRNNFNSSPSLPKAWVLAHAEPLSLVPCTYTMY